MSRFNLDPYCFGPPGWHFLHSVAAGYPEKDVTADVKEQYRIFFTMVGNVLPCETCRVNYSNNLKRLPIEGFLETRRDLSYWLYQIHNFVNEETGKNVSISFDDVYDKYTRYALPCDSTNKICGKEKHKQCQIYIKDAMENKNTYMYINNNKYLLLFILFLIVVIIIMGVNIKKKK